MKATCAKLPSKKKRYTAAIGIFDGIHTGHRFILEKLKKQAHLRNRAPLVITFSIPPQQFLNKDLISHGHRIRKKFLGCLTGPKQKKSFIKDLGINDVWFLKTNQGLLKMPAEDFINYIRGNFKIEEFIVGDDFRFGYAGRAGVSCLKSLALKKGFKARIINKKRKDKKIVSSSLIRELVMKGELKEAEKFLGREFSLEGKVSGGNKMGSKLGFPTANIYSLDYVTPPEGVYAARAAVGKREYLAAVNIGKRPTITRAKKAVIEVHIINFNKNILGKTLQVTFLKKLREEKKFSSKALLKKAIRKDLDYITSKYSVPPPK